MHAGTLPRLAEVSIHAPARGATIGRSLIRALGVCFNPRAREGRDVTAAVLRQSCCRFNPRAREGRDLPHLDQLDESDVFQSTRPRGARPAAGAAGRADHGVSIHAPARGATPDAQPPPAASCRFNPRAREGRDLPHLDQLDESDVFQSTRPRGARPAAGAAGRADHGVSIHAPARGATPDAQPPPAASCRFNPRAREGRDA